jgi:hypothetical protein
MSVSLSALAGAGAQFFDDSGTPLAGGKIGTFLAGTTTPAVTYTTSDGDVPNANPIILNAAGRVDEQVWLPNGIAYKFIVTDFEDVLVGTYDNLYGVAASV